MPYTELPLGELRAYQPDLDPPADLEDFWAGTLAEARTHSLDASFERVHTDLRLIDVFDVSFRGFGSDPEA